MINDEADEDSHKNRYQNNLESMIGCKIMFVFDYVYLLYYKCHKKIRIVGDHI